MRAAADGAGRADVRSRHELAGRRLSRAGISRQLTVKKPFEISGCDPASRPFANCGFVKSPYDPLKALAGRVASAVRVTHWEIVATISDFERLLEKLIPMTGARP